MTNRGGGCKETEETGGGSEGKKKWKTLSEKMDKKRW